MVAVKLGIFLLSVIILTNNMTAQTQVGSDIDGEESLDLFGWATAIAGNGQRVAAGAVFNNNGGLNSGNVRVFGEISGEWFLVGNPINAGAFDQFYGAAVALSEDGTRLAIGAPQSDEAGFDRGKVEVYEEVGGVWVQLGATINGEDFNDQFGEDVALSNDGNILAASSQFHTDALANAGRVRVFEWIAGDWVQMGNSIIGDLAFGQLGNSLALSNDGTTIVVGAASYNGPAGSFSGKVQVFEFTAGVWIPIGSDIFGENQFDLCGYDVDISGDGGRIILSLRADFLTVTGKVRIFDFIAGDWVQVGSDIFGDANNDLFGESVSISNDGSTFVAGAIGNTDNGTQAGHTKIFTETAGVWTQVGTNISSEAANDNSGWSVSLSSSGQRIATSAPYNDGISGVDSGHVRVFEIQCAGPVGWIKQE